MNEIFYFAITIAILVFVHEFGHFIAAKLSGMRAEVFAIGYGKRLLGWNKKTGFSFGELDKDLDLGNETDYRICLLPLGGYVKVAGMVDESMDTKFVETEPQPYEFRAKPLPKKIFVLVAGVAMNLFLTFAIFWGVNFFYGKQVSKTTTIYVSEATLADSLGFKLNDKIISINGVKVNYWEEVRTKIFVDFLGEDLKFEINRNGEDVFLKVPRKKVPADESTKAFLTPLGMKPFIVDILEDSPADSAGIKANDVFLAVNGTDIHSVEQTKEIISTHPAQKIEIQLLRENDTVIVHATPDKEGKVGVMFGGQAYLGTTEKVKYGFFASMSLGVADISNMTQLTFMMLRKVIIGDVELGKAFGGPVKIAQYAARSADSGIISFLMFIGLLSLSLAILNILPFPVLDGGHLVIVIIEAIFKKEIPIKVKIAIQNTGFVLLMILMAFILYNDIINL